MNQDINKDCAFLLALLPDGIVKRAALSTLGGNETHNSKTIKSLIDNGYIEIRTITIKTKPRPYQETFLTVTKKGLRYLADSCGDKIPFLNALVLTDGRLNIRGGVGNEKLLRTLAVKDAEIMLRECGCSTEIDNMAMSVETREGTLRDIVRNAIIQTVDISGECTDQKLPRFINSKEMLPLMNLSKEGASQYIFSPHTGLLATGKDAYLTYRTGHFGMPWHGGAAFRFAGVASRVALDIAGPNSAYCGGVKRGFLFTKNAHEFELAYNDANHKRKQKNPEKKHELGYPFEHFYAIPTTKDGLELLRMILQMGDLFEDAFVYSFSSFLFFNDGKFHRIFKYRDKDSLLFSGLTMDIRAIQALERYKDMLDEDYKILCFPWQMDFYRRIFPDVEFHVLIMTTIG